MKNFIDVKNTGIFLFLGICFIPSLMNGQNILFPGDDLLIKQLNITDDAINTTPVTFPSSNNSCRTPDGEPGECIALGKCPELTTYIRENGIQNHETVRFLRSRICRYLLRNVHLCCRKAPTVLPSVHDCGFSTSNKILEGIELPHGSHPWLVAVGVPLGEDKFRALCGGTLITKRHVLTASHCFMRNPGTASPTHVRLGDYSLSQNTEQLPAISMAIIDRKSPGYDSFTHLNDIELLTLEKEVNFTPFIQPVCLPFNFRGVNLDQKEMSIIGWGDKTYKSGVGSDVPLFANITVVPKAECRKKYDIFPEVPLDRTQFCAGMGAKDTCQGDSGGPLLYLDLENEYRYFLMGIVSFGIGCGNPDFPGVYTFVPEFTDWIVSNIQ